MKSNLENDSSQIGTYMIPPYVEAYKHLKKYDWNLEHHLLDSPFCLIDLFFEKSPRLFIRSDKIVGCCVKIINLKLVYSKYRVTLRL